MKTNDLKDKWNEFKGHNGYLQRLDPSHPMDFFIGISERGYEELALFTTVEPAQLSSSKALAVEKHVRKTDGKWATQISLLESDNQDLFARLCLDLVECSVKCVSEADGLSRVTKRYLAWQKLFAKLKDTLPVSVLKGLIGELDFLKYLINSGVSKDDAISAWQGPEGADRDFVLLGSWVENKAISTGKSQVKISSLNQLEIDTPGFLSIVLIDESSVTDSKAFSVKSYIDDFRELISDAPAASILFEQKLVSVGFVDKTAYENMFFLIGERSYYRVNDTFPKLVTDNVPIEIVAAEYNLSLPGLFPWKIEEVELWK